MKNNEEVAGCDICYKTEQLKMPSSRTFAKSYDNIPKKNLPTMLDIDFSNFCNLKCVMCNATRSSEWAKDKGWHKETSGVSSTPIKMIDDLILISDDVQHITIQGGEATIMPEYEYYFSALDKKALTKNIDLQIITNATNVNQRFYKLLEKFKKVRLSVSIDAYGLANDYIRWPSKFIQIEKNLVKMSELSANVEVEILNSLNVLSMFDYYKFLKWCRKIENIFVTKKKIFKVCPMKIQSPKIWSPFCAPKDLKNRFINDTLKFMSEYKLSKHSNWSTEMTLILKQIQASPEDTANMQDLKMAIAELDQKRNKKISDYIPDFGKYF